MKKSLVKMTGGTFDKVDPRWRGLILASSVLLIAIPFASLCALYLARTLYTTGYPGDAAAYLQLVSQHQGMASLAWSLWIITDILSIAPIISMYIVLRPHNQALALLGSLLAVFYAIYDVSATELNSLTLVSLSNGYVGSSTEALRSSILAAATYGYYALPFQTVLSFGIGSLAYLLWCVPMWKSLFGRWTAVFGVFVNVIGVIGSASPLVPSSFILSLCLFLAPRAIALWSIVLGVQMFRYGLRIPSRVAEIADMP
jgi:hypothetical protein